MNIFGVHTQKNGEYGYVNTFFQLDRIECVVAWKHLWSAYTGSVTEKHCEHVIRGGIIYKLKQHPCINRDARIGEYYGFNDEDIAGEPFDYFGEKQ